MDEIALTAADGQALTADVAVPVGPPRGVLVYAHAMMADRRTWWRAGAAQAFVDEGWIAWTLDLRGRRGAPADHYRYTDHLRLDLPAAVDAARLRHPGLPVCLVGHSLGAHAGLAAIAEGRVAVDAWVGFGANIWLPSLEPSRRLRARKALTMAAFARLARWSGRFPSRRLRIGPVDEAAAFVDDLTGFWVRDRWMAPDGFDWGAALAQVAVPCLSVLSDGDRWMAHPVAASAWIRPVPDHTVLRLAGPPGVAPDHMELVTSSIGGRGWRGASDWLAARFDRIG